ncbi:hypothetical protein FZEAL_8779 [Fusarium zealandicum]|uniref:Derlin n=1 Tax=Fusarium zealandicum TaxID=1053134 RepID=A0A8H4UDS3_9HYPO|nr:hypothetical protein FZEAL_8779 [Fusarium zealandicum]
MAEGALAAYWELPAVARTLTTATVVLSIGCLTGVLPVGLLIHHPFYLWKIPPQIWRPITCFFIADHPLNLLFDAYFLYKYTTQLEVGHPRFPRKVDLVWYIMFICGTILMIDYIVGLSLFKYLPGIILAMTYTVTQDQRGMKTTFYVIQVPAQTLPYCMIIASLLMPGGYTHALVQLEGLVAAHLFDFLGRIWPEFGGGPNLLRTPGWLQRIVTTPRAVQRGSGTAIRNGSSTGSSTGAQAGPLPDSWRSRGRGQRLG